jgi:tRNA dimethylallyltransferase
MPIQAILIYGPTASGKTQLAQELAARHDVRLVSADSMQVYRGMDIGTAKPEGQWREQWHCLDLADPGEAFSVGAWLSFVEKEIEQARKEGKLALIAGGTGLYFNALTQGLAPIPDVPAHIRQAWEERLSDQGLANMVRLLQKQDPELAREIDLKNPRRVLRGLEVFEATGRPLSYWQTHTSAPLLSAPQVAWLGLDSDMELLEKSIQKRTQTMFAAGWLDEAKSLSATYGAEAILKTGAIGYFECLEVLSGRMPIHQAQEAVQLKTRQYAKRQKTWFTRFTNIHKVADLFACQMLLASHLGSK